MGKKINHANVIIREDRFKTNEYYQGWRMPLQNKGVNLITILNVYANNNRASKYLKQKLTELKEGKKKKKKQKNSELQLETPTLLSQYSTE